jgi:hypothetical protein
LRFQIAAKAVFAQLAENAGATNCVHAQNAEFCGVKVVVKPSQGKSR